MTQDEVFDILNNIFGLDSFELMEWDDALNEKAYVFSSVEMEELLELSKQIKTIDKNNTFEIKYIPTFTSPYHGFAIIFFKWME